MPAYTATPAFQSADASAGRPVVRPEGDSTPREMDVRAGLGIAATVRQGRGLEILRMRVDHPALIVVDRGIKSVRGQGTPTARAVAGQALVLSGNQTVDFSNTVTQGLHYEARWLVFDPMLLEDPCYRVGARQVASDDGSRLGARLLAEVSPGLAEAFERARESLTARPLLPASVVRGRLLEVAFWLLEQSVVLHVPAVNPTTSMKVRSLVAGRLDAGWTAAQVAAALAQSEATLRRRLAVEGTSLTELLGDTRMAMALTLLQTTARPVAHIAAEVGYESASRFSARFRQRFGFSPTSVRNRAHPPS